MKTYDVIIIGFGKGGKTLAVELAERNWKVAMIEEDSMMYGGTCINIACIPTKTLAYDSIQGISYEDAIRRKDQVVETLRKKNYHNLADHQNITIYDASARFRSDKEIVVKQNDMEEVLTAEHIVINTGAVHLLPPLGGNGNAANIYTSTSLINRKKLPKRLVIIGAGYIGLEYASMYQEFGAEVTVIVPDDELFSGEDAEVAEEVRKVLEEKGICFQFGHKAEKIREERNSSLTITLKDGKELVADAVLLATGRKPNTEGLGLEKTNIQVKDDGAILVNNHLETTVANVWAIGDVKGGMQFTYTSLDDSRIVSSALFEKGLYTMNERQHVPYSVFIDPPFSRVGMTAEEARKQGYDVGEGRLPVKAHPRAHVINDFRGLFKVVVDRKGGEILGASLFGPESSEMINLIKLAMDIGIPYLKLRDQVYNHPVMTEAFNALFDIK